MIRLKEIREDCDLTQKEVADYVGVTCQTLSNWERQITEPDIRSLIKLSTLYQVSIDYLLGHYVEEDSIKVEDLKRVNGKKLSEILIDSIKRSII